MELYKLFLEPVFELLEYTIKVPLDTTGNKFLQIPLYLIIVFVFLINLIGYFYDRIFDNGE